jgi:hypothetical protein
MLYAFRETDILATSSANNILVDLKKGTLTLGGLYETQTSSWCHSHPKTTH